MVGPLLRLGAVAAAALALAACSGDDSTESETTAEGSDRGHRLRHDA